MAFQEVIDAKQRIIQEFVPGRQVTIAHVIANPKPDLFRKMGALRKRTQCYWNSYHNTWRRDHYCSRYCK